MPCDIYLASDILSLDALAKKSSSVLKNIKLRQAYKATDRLYTSLSTETKDEEKKYVHMSRFLFMLDYIYNLENDKKYLHSKYGSAKSQVVKEQQVLRENLIKRYDDFHKSVKELVIEEEDTPMLTDEVDEISIFELDEKDRFVTSQQLLEQCRSGRNILIMDMRSKNDFNNSHLKINTVINIDESVVLPGLSANTLGEKLEKPIKDVYDKRSTFDFIILMDFDTTPEFFEKSKIKNLFTILTEWDYNTMYKYPPSILKGGYMNFIDSYPTYSTNPKILLQHINADLDDFLDLDSVHYPEELTPTKEEANRIKVEIDDTYTKIVDLTTLLLELEKKMLENQYKIYDSTSNTNMKNELEEKNERIAATKSKLVTKSKTMNAKLKTLLEKRPRESIKYKSEIGRLESEIVILSRERRKLVDMHKVVEVPNTLTTPTPPIPPKVMQAVGDKPSQILPDTLRPQIPTIDRKTKPKIYPNSLRENSGLVGLVNIRNTCYINSIIQCLRYLPSIKKYFMSNRYEHDISRKPPQLITQMGDLINKLWTTPNKSITPSDFYRRISELNPTFKRGNHEDASEFFMFLYDQVFEDTASPVDADKFSDVKYKTLYERIQFRTSFFVREFFHQILTNCICPGCSKRCLKHEVENMFMFGLPEDGTFSLEDTTYKFIHTSDISEYFCSKCEKQTSSIREVSHQPKVIAILLKRYVYTKGYAEKVNIPVEFPLDKFRVGKAVYKLWSVSLHQGTLQAGHYTAACLNHVDGMWYEFNDEIVKPIDVTSQAVKERAYMLFYESHPGSPVGFVE